MSQRFTDTFDAKPLSNYEQKAILALELISPGLSRQDMADVVNHASPRVETDEACHTPVEFVEALWTAYTGRLELDEYCMRRTLAEDVDETAMQDLIETVESVAMVLQEFGMPFRSTTDESKHIVKISQGEILTMPQSTFTRSHTAATPGRHGGLLPSASTCSFSPGESTASTGFGVPRSLLGLAQKETSRHAITSTATALSTDCSRTSRQSWLGSRRHSGNLSIMLQRICAGLRRTRRW